MIGAALQKSVYEALTAFPALCGGRVFDRAPEGVGYPLITIGDEQVIDDSNSCSPAWEVYVDVHVWSRASSKIEVKDIASAVIERLAVDLVVPGFAVLGMLETQRTRRDPNDTEHAVITFRYLIDPIGD